MYKLTVKQQNILDTLREFIVTHKENPTPYGLHKHLATHGVSDSLKSVMQVIEALEKKDLLTRDEQRRMYVVQNDDYADLQNIFSMPLYGLASCGDALAYAQDNVEGYLQVSQSLFRHEEPAKLFAVKALGDSMDRDNIHDGDYIVFEKYENQTDVENKIVVAVINGMATIKRFKKVGGGVIGLFPHSTNLVHQPIFIHENDTVLIAGVFRRVLPVRYVSI
ncbi:MAG TPA: S24 family peptidase [Patescibacteria group bacterium]|nr:S24 family peptidase [Patescibacteria group bacterium]